jgi:hypothetical protein
MEEIRVKTEEERRRDGGGTEEEESSHGNSGAWIGKL